MCNTAKELIARDVNPLKAFASAPVWALLAGAATWGVVWYPYRLLAHAGLDGAWSTVLTYGVALVVGGSAFRGAAASLKGMPAAAYLMGAAIGWSNLAYVLAVIDGEVMRVLLLFYLAPLWTVPLAWLVLGERLDAAGMAVMALAFAGAMVMLWHPQAAFPWPRDRADWLGLAAGFLFALGNVLVRKLSGMGDAAKSIVIWAGVTLAGLVQVALTGSDAPAAMEAARTGAPIVLGIGLALVVMSLALQYGLSRLPANRAIVILLFELVVAALAAYLLAGEVLRPTEWIGGGLIVAAGLASGWVKAR
ncbi:MAG TPA: DMT family transporter [Usitatibacter sp.]|jgi:drug/metabolite transporter (DMT)-like permease|nr:DMT family transporter [Usitatibacter sp.]